MLNIISKLIYPNNVLFLFYTSIGISTILFLLKKNIKLFLLIISPLLLFYFSPKILLILIVFYSIYLLSSNFYYFIGYFFALIQIYYILGLLINPKISLYFIFGLLSLIIIIKRKKNKPIINFINNLNYLDIFIITFVFITSSLPQFHWDAVHANLYNAKWYILNNSFLPLKESISSLFPQNAIVYYSFFYQLLGLKGFQLSFILPLIFLLYFIKRFPAKNYLYLLIFTPIVFFQASNGYYDLLLALVCLIGVFSASSGYIFISSLLFGFAAASKYFPIAFFPLPYLMLFTKKQFNLKKFFVVSLLLITPLTISCLRTYNYTGSPIFPFAQSIFPTPSLWSKTDILENNPMIQTSISTKQWILGGFLYYPFSTFFKSANFIESTNGYPTLTYIFLLPLLFFTLNYSFIAYLLVGLVTRYYRYVWPFQFILYFYALTNIKKFPKFFSLLIIPLLLLNIFNIYKMYRTLPINTKQFFKPNYYQLASADNGPIVFLNKTKAKKVLDASSNFLPRINITPITYQCSWYWINWQKSFTTLNEFEYLVTSNPVASSNNFCQNQITKQAHQLSKVYEDKDYLIFKINK